MPTDRSRKSGALSLGQEERHKMWNSTVAVIVQPARFIKNPRPMKEPLQSVGTHFLAVALWLLKTRCPSEMMFCLSVPNLAHYGLRASYPRVFLSLPTSEGSRWFKLSAWAFRRKNVHKELGISTKGRSQRAGHFDQRTFTKSWAFRRKDVYKELGISTKGRSQRAGHFDERTFTKSWAFRRKDVHKELGISTKGRLQRTWSWISGRPFKKRFFYSKLTGTASSEVTHILVSLLVPNEARPHSPETLRARRSQQTWW